MLRIPNVLVVNPDLTAKSTAELVAYAKANPGGCSRDARVAKGCSYSF